MSSSARQAGGGISSNAGGGMSSKTRQAWRRAAAFHQGIDRVEQLAGCNNQQGLPPRSMGHHQPPLFP